MNMMKKTVIASGIALALGSTGASAALVQDVMGAYNFNTVAANFTMQTGTGYMQGGTNNVNMTWDGNAFSASSDYTGMGSVSNVTAASTSTFSSHTWSAHDIQVFLPGSYSFDTSLGVAPAGMAEALGGGMLNVVVPDGQLGMHMLFDWGTTANIDVFVVAALNTVYGAGVTRTVANAAQCAGTATTAPNIQNCLWNSGTVPGMAPGQNKVWQLATVDGDGDGIMGIAMVDGPFAGFNAGFNATFETITPDIIVDPIPVPAAVWLFGSGLLGLAGVARRKASKA